MSITSYAQNFEDVMLWRALGHVPKGFYIDIGAQHPVTDSVSKAFYEKGWRGIHVEATPAYAALLRQDRPDETVLEAVVNDVHGVISFFEIPDTGISTGDPDVARSHQARGFDVHEIVLPCVTLEDIFKQAGTQDIHWLKVDVESMEHQVLRSWGQSPARPWVVVVESTVPLTQIDSHLPWENCLLERGYTHAYFDGLNRYYLAADQQHLASAFASSPNVFDGFTLSGDASAPFCVGINDKHRLALQALQDQLSAKDHQTRQLQDQLHAKEQEALQLLEHQARQAAQHQALECKWQAQLRALQERCKEAEHDHVLKELALQQLATQKYQEAQTQVNNLLQNLAQRENAFAAQVHALQAELNVVQQAAHQRTLALEIEAREREQALLIKVAADIQQANHQAQVRLDTLDQRHQHKENALQAEKAQLQQCLEESHAESQKHLQALVERERVFSKVLHELQVELHQQAHSWKAEKKDLAREIERLQLNLESQKAAATAQAHQHARLLEEQAAAHQKALTDCAALEAQLKAELLNERHNSQQLSHSLNGVRSTLAATQASWTWRATAPLRGLCALFIPKSNLQQSPLLTSVTLVPQEPVPSLSSSQPMSADSDQPMPAYSPHTVSSASAESLDDLLGRQGLDFVHCAYQTLLGRAPDPAGLAYYMGRLQQGYSGLKVLAQLRLSSEGKSYATSLRGLDDAIARYRRAHRPFLGWVFRWFSSTEDDRPSARNLRRISHQVALLGQNSQLRLQHIELKLEHVHSLLGQRINRDEDPIAISGEETTTNVNEALAQLPVRARQIYFQLKTAANKHAVRFN